MASITAKSGSKPHNTLLRPDSLPEIQGKLFPNEEKGPPVIRKAPSEIALDIRFALLDHEGDRGWNLAAINSRHNIGEFYRSLYKGIFYNGHAPDYSKYTIHLEAEDRFFSPDITMNGLYGTDFTEIKGRHMGNSQQHCRKAQVENYSFALLQRIDQEDMVPSVNYAFFMYGDSNPLKLYSMAPDEAMKKLAESTKELLIVPLNIAFLIFRMSKTDAHGRDMRESGAHWAVNGHLLRKLHEATLDLPEIIEYHGKKHRIDIDAVKKFARRPSLHLNHIVVRKQYSDEIKELRYGDTGIMPFQITTYSLTHPEMWNRSFFKHHSNILYEIGVRDTYTEWRKSILPF